MYVFQLSPSPTNITKFTEIYPVENICLPYPECFDLFTFDT
jgi:hypothetical protein